jgi:inner membrane protein
MERAMEATDRSPGLKLMLAVCVAAMLAVPLFMVYLLTYDRERQSETARASIAQGWGGPQRIAGPMLVLPYTVVTTETVKENGRDVTRTGTADGELYLAPADIKLTSQVQPERRSRSIYEAVVYAAEQQGRATFQMPADLARLGVPIERIAFDRAEIRFGIADPRGLRSDSRVTVNGTAVAPQPGNGLAATGGAGFFVFTDAAAMRGAPLTVDFRFSVRGHTDLTLSPRAGHTEWTIASPWPHPSFGGGFLPDTRSVSPQGFSASYRISNLALGTTLLTRGDPTAAAPGTDAGDENPYGMPGRSRSAAPASGNDMRIELIQPVDLYSQINRSVKYGFLFIAFTFMAFLMFDVIGGHRVSAIEYLLVGSGLVLFFVMLLAFAEVIGFLPAYLVASAAIVVLLTAYSAAVLGSRGRAGTIAGLLVALYAVLYVLLSLEDYSLLIGSVLLFAALAAIMYLTRNLEWGARTVAVEPEPAPE